jgi:hypothetical protein
MRKVQHIKHEPKKIIRGQFFKIFANTVSVSLAPRSKEPGAIANLFVIQK